jgi:hypothetical protein
MEYSRGGPLGLQYFSWLGDPPITVAADQAIAECAPAEIAEAWD